MRINNNLVVVSENTTIGSNVSFYGKGEIQIGSGAEIRSGAILYSGVSIGTDTIVGHNAIIENDCKIGNSTFIGNGCVLRPDTKIGDDCTIGHLTVFEGECKVGNGTLIHAQCHVTKGASIGDNVFIAPFFVGANDPVMQHRRCMIFGEFKPSGYIIGDNVRIAISVSVLPGVWIGDNAVIGAKALVTKDVPHGEVWAGVPAKFMRNVNKEELL